MTQRDFAEILARNPRRIESRRLYMQLAQDAGAFAAVFLFCRFSPETWMRLAVAPVVAALCFRAFSMMHDCVHAAASRSSSVNRWVGEFYGILCFLPFSSWRDLHMDHHRHTGNVDRDPTMAIVKKFRDDGFKAPAYVSFCWRSGVPLLALLQHVVFWRATLKSREFIFAGGVVAFWGSLAWATGPWALAAAALIYLHAVEVVNFPHHLGLRQFSGEKRVAPREQAEFARSCIYPRWIANNILLNFNYHIEHHLYPAYPWYQLAELHAELKRLPEPFNFVPGNAWIRECRTMPIEEVFRLSLAEAAEERAAA